MSNPLQASSGLPHEAIAFDQIRVEHFVPALTAAIAGAKAQLDAIKTDSRAPDFANSIIALETATAQVHDIAYVYSNLKSAHGDQAMHALSKEIMPKLIELESDINLDAVLFQRVQAVHDRRASLGLDSEQMTLVERTYRSFRRNGAVLSPEGKAKLRTIDEQLSTLGPQFSENVLKATNSFELWIEDRKKLAGLPDSALEAAAVSAEEKGRPGSYLFTLQAPSVLPFMKYLDSRELRQELWTAANSRALRGPNSNLDIVKKIATLRFQRARLLGYDSHGHFQMEERMAEHPDKVRSFLGRLLDKSKAAALREMEELRAYMKKGSDKDDLMPWDYSYWANRLEEERYDVNAEELRPYFKLENVLAGAFEVAGRLYDLEFKVTTSVPVYAPDVSVFEVRSRKSGDFMGLFYADFHPRSTKSGGAWCTRFKSQWRSDGQSHRPHVSIVCNMTKPTPTKPSLLTYDEAVTVFHEFGHALHSLLSQCAYRSLSCTNVYRDFVELPSQIMENWLREKDSLALVARHYETGAPLPEDLLKKLLASENFHAAYFMMRQLRFALLDLSWYASDPSEALDVEAFEAQAIKATELFPRVPGTNISCSFEHIFSGGYSAGYYGYKWAEVLSADAFELFKESDRPGHSGVFSKDVADRFRKEILERGGSEHPMVLYKRFRGREPDPDALLRRSQLI